MAIKTTKHLFLLFLIFAPSTYTIPTVPVSEHTYFKSLESRETDVTTVIKASDGNPVQIDLWSDGRCGKSKGPKPPSNASVMINTVEYGVAYSLRNSLITTRISMGYSRASVSAVI